MLDIIKNLAQNALAEKFGNIAGDTAAQSEAGANGLMDVIQSQLGSGGISALTGLLSGQGDGGNILSELQDKLGGALQQNGISADEAKAQAAQTAPDLLNTLKDKFLSQDQADAGFDLSQLSGLLGGGGGDLLSKAKGAANLLNTAKSLFK